ncbi:hypothetical protein [uncultured Methylobacterium sp.]|uniref:hypothetical protein n=1 Tax=uncultured Methylobacterium sp. TaxID=157278 RepID=UPI0035CB2D18
MAGGFEGLDKPQPPARYRALLLSAAGQVLRMEHLPASDDADAMRRARLLVDGHAVELWDGVRFIERFEPSDGSD